MLDALYIGDRVAIDRATGESHIVDLCVVGEHGRPLLRALVRPDAPLEGLDGLSDTDRALLTGAPTLSDLEPMLADALGGAGRLVGVFPAYLDLPLCLQRVIPCEVVAQRLGLFLGLPPERAFVGGADVAIKVARWLRPEVVRDEMLWGAYEKAAAAHALSDWLDTHGVPGHVSNGHLLVGNRD